MEIERNASTPHVLEIPTVCTIEEAAIVLRLRSPTKIYELLSAGKLRSILVGAQRRISGQSIAELLRDGEQQTYAPSRPSPNPAAKQKKNAGGDKVREAA